LQRYLAWNRLVPPRSFESIHKDGRLIDNYSARATMEYKGTKVSGEFHLTKTEILKNVSNALPRFKGTPELPNGELLTSTKTEEMNGMKIKPVGVRKQSWELESGKWTWLKLKIKRTSVQLVKGNCQWLTMNIKKTKRRNSNKIQSF